MRKTIYSDYSDAIRQKLITMRQSAKMTQRQVAKRLKRVHNFVARVELGERRIDLAEFFQYARACKADPQKEIASLIREFEMIERNAGST